MKIRKLGTGRDFMTKFQQADEMDARSIRAFVNDPKSWNPLYLYHAPGAPTFAGAVLSAQQVDLRVLSTSPKRLLNSARVAISLFMSLSPTVPVVEVGLDFTLSPSWLVGSPIVTPYGR